MDHMDIMAIHLMGMDMDPTVILLMGMDLMVILLMGMEDLVMINFMDMEDHIKLNIMDLIISNIMVLIKANPIVPKMDLLMLLLKILHIIMHKMEI
jgi:hypothetical protein